MVRSVLFSMKRPPATKREPQMNRAEIAQVAYELFQRRGRTHGHDQQDWFEAERIMRQHQGRKQAAR